MNELEYIHFNNRDEFRNWLQKFHDKSPGIWMIYYRKHTGKESILYIEALEEALCYGWVDSIIKKTDEDKYVRKFTPRKNFTNWSDFNKNKVFELIEKGKMTPAGLEKIDATILSSILAKENFQTGNKKVKEFDIPDFIIEEFRLNEPALRNFNNLAPSHKREYIFWITNAKRQETIAGRIRESVKLLIENKKLGLK